MTQPTTAPPATTALVVLEDQGIEFNLDGFPVGQYNRLIPTETIRMPSDLMVPVVQIVRLDPSADGGDVYHSNDMKAGHNAPTARGLSKLATAAGVSFFDERRVDDGKDPNVCGVTVYARMTLPTGQVQQYPGSRWVQMASMPWKDGLSGNQANKFRSFLYEHTATRARNRALRGLLSLRGSYPERQLALPFAVVSFVPNMNQPEVRERILSAMVPVVAQLYGPEPAPQLAAGQIITGPEAPEDDADDGVIDGQATDAGPEPSWFGATEAASDATASTQTPAMRLAAVLRAKAAASGMVGPATAPQLQKLAAIFVAAAISRPETDAGLRMIFGVTGRADFLGSQANALIEASVDAEFGDLWREVVAGDGAQAG
jgi:hypothetical protein